MTAPSDQDVLAYLGNTEWDEDTVTAAYNAEKSAQAKRCRVPDDDEDWPADLAEALCRRVAANLAARALPLGVQPAITEVGAAFTRVGGLDREVRRLEGPYRRVVLA